MFSDSFLARLRYLFMLIVLHDIGTATSYTSLSPPQTQSHRVVSKPFLDYALVGRGAAFARKILAFFEWHAEMNKGFSWITGMHYISLLASGQAFASLLLTTIMSQSQDGT